MLKINSEQKLRTWKYKKILINFLNVEKMKTTIHQDTHEIVDALAELTPSIKKGKMTITAANTDIDVSEIVDFKYKEDAAGTNERVDFTVAASPTLGAEYKVTLMIKRALGEEIERVTASVIAATATAASVAQQLVDALNALQGTPVTAVLSTADVQITINTASGEVAGEADLVEVKVAKDGAASFATSEGVARVIPYGQGTTVKRFDDAAGVNFNGTADVSATYDEATFYLASESGTERRKITIWLKAGTSGINYMRTVLKSLGSVSGADDGDSLVPTDAASDATGDIYIGCPVVSAAGTAGAGIDLISGAPVGTVVKVLNTAGSTLKVTREGSETINGAADYVTIGANKAASLTKMSSLAWLAVLDT